jgi:RNA polymerase sigma-70 factor (ECF subfamily)
MYYVNNLSLQEIAGVLDLPVGTIKSRLHYGRQTLKQQMEVQNGVMPKVGYEFT